MTGRAATLDDLLAELRAMREILEKIDRSTWQMAIEAGNGGCSFDGGAPVPVVVIEGPEPAAPKRKTRTSTAKG